MSDLFQDARDLVAVLPAAQVAGPYTYAPPPGARLEPGDMVRVRLSGREVPGVVWGPGGAASSAREAGARCDVPPLSAAMRGFVDRAARYTMTPAGSVLKMVLCVPAALDPESPQMGWRAAGPAPEGLTSQQGRALEALAGGTPRSAAEIARAAGVSAGVVKTLVGRGLVERAPLPAPAPCEAPDLVRAGPELSPDQRAAADQICAQIGRGHQTFVLDGVTGSGKTEVYFEAVAAALRSGRQALILLPEIALTAVFVDRFERRFGCAPALWHSGLTPVQRARTWRAVAQGRTRVVAGARSALFLPFAGLGALIVDEEHEGAYKQAEGALYHARDMAVLRGACEGVPVVLASATPALETMENAWSGRYARLTLPDRFGGARMPRVEALDMRAEPPPAGAFLSPALRAALAQTLARGEQALLFLNRRGYAPLTLCQACGHQLECPSCTAWLVAHRGRGLLCHHCGYRAPKAPKSCPACATEGDIWVECGPGVERVAEEAAQAFPDARCMTLASDTAGGPTVLRDALQAVENGDVDIVIGTQIVAKGHHFPGLTLVGVVDADLGLAGGELRAAERTYQLLHQVAGRAGRADKPGRVLLQSWAPEGAIIRALVAGDRDGFYRAEAAERRAARMPPYTRLIALIISGVEEPAAEAGARTLGAAAPGAGGVEVLGPAPAPMARIRGRWRWRLLVRAEKGIDLQAVVGDWLAATKMPGGVRVQIDVDPQVFL